MMHKLIEIYMIFLLGACGTLVGSPDPIVVNDDDTTPKIEISLDQDISDTDEQDSDKNRDDKNAREDAVRTTMEDHQTPQAAPDLLERFEDQDAQNSNNTKLASNAVGFFLTTTPSEIFNSIKLKVKSVSLKLANGIVTNHPLNKYIEFGSVRNKKILLSSLKIDENASYQEVTIHFDAREDPVGILKEGGQIVDINLPIEARETTVKMDNFKFDLSDPQLILSLNLNQAIQKIEDQDGNTLYTMNLTFKLYKFDDIGKLKIFIEGKTGCIYQVSIPEGDTNLCENAILVESLIENRLLAEKLEPGIYNIRLFQKDGNFIDFEKIEIIAGMRTVIRLSD